MAQDILIQGAGPAGLAMARALSGHGLTIRVFDRSTAQSLAAPAEDGREIALTHRSETLLRQLGIWQRLDGHEIAPLRGALVLDGDAHEGLSFAAPGPDQALGWMVPNHALRRASHAAVAACADIELCTQAEVVSVHGDGDAIELGLADGSRHRGALLIAADSRFSAARRAMGIAADQHDFGKVMLLVRVRHQRPHDGIAWEWFRHGQTLALLPLHDPHTSSAVLTLAPQQARFLKELSVDALAADLTARFDQRLGSMQPLGPVHAYPLVAVYPRRLVAPRFALLGDAAVGMHPVTAHGYNFGLLGVATLAALLLEARRRGEDWQGPGVLLEYERRLRRSTRPLYLATRLIATIYTDDRPPARILRKLALGAAARLPGFRQAVQRGLADRGQGPAPRWPLCRQLLRTLTG